MNSFVAETGVENLDKSSRLFRLLVGAGLIAFVMTTPDAPLGWYAVLPLLAVFPIFSAITGWDPLKALFTHRTTTRWALSFSLPTRLAIGAIGVAMIASVYVAAYVGASLGWLVILPIVGIYPVFAAIAGMDPITALYNLDRGLERDMEAVEAPTVIGQPAFGVIKGRKVSQVPQEKSHSKAA